MRINRILSASLSLVMLTSILVTVFTPSPVKALSGSDFNAGRIIDDHVFFDGSTMSTDGIQAFLNSKVPSCDTNHAAGGGYSPPFVCLRNYSQDIPGKIADQYCTGAVGGGVKTAAQIIKDVAVACSISPKVLLVLLQKEQSLVTDTWPWPPQYQKATGYACPDTSACDTEYEGFFNQVWWGARQFQRYAKQANLFGYKTGRNNTIYYNPGPCQTRDSSGNCTLYYGRFGNRGDIEYCGSTTVYIQNQATAGLYNYTPYQPNPSALANLYGSGDQCGAYGNRNFWRIYSDWFGSPVSNVCYNGTGTSSTNVMYHKYDSLAENADLTIYSGASTNCVEAHIWNSGEMSWKTHIASAQPSIDYPYTQLLYGDLDGSGRDYPVIFGLQNTSTGKVESHVLNKDMKTFLAHAASSQPVLNVSDANIRIADLNGDGKDEPIIVAYRNTGSGKIEFHGWAPGMQSWLYHIASNRDAIDPSDNIIEFGDIDGDGTDEAVLISLRHTGSSKIEFHVWNPGLYSWKTHIASNMPEIDPATSRVVFADIDGNGTDEAVLIGLKNTGSGKIEFHVWNPGFTSWKSHTASNQPY